MFHEPVKMVVVSLIASIILIAGVLIYRFVYPKKKVNLLALLILISLLPIISLLRKGTYQSGLLSEQVGVEFVFYSSLAEGIIKPLWAAKICSGFGCPLFVFQYPLPFYIPALFHFFGMSVLSSTKLLLGISFVASGVAMYYWAKNELGKVPGFVAAIFYLFAPYHLSTMHFRVSTGEVLSFVFPPLILLYSKKILDTGRYYWFLLNALSLALLILSHQVTSLITMPFIFFYIFVTYFRLKNKKLKNLIYTFISLGFGLVLSAFYWLPVLVEGKYILLARANDVTFQPFWYYFYSPFQYRFGLLFQGNHGELYTNIGYIPLIILAISLVLLYKRKLGSYTSLYLFLFISTIIYFVMMQKITQPIWHSIRLLLDIQFTWRFLIEVSLAVSLIAGIVVKVINKNWFTVLISALAIWITILNWGNRMTLPNVTDANFVNAIYLEKPCTVELSTPIWVNICAPWIGKYPKEHLQTLTGQASIRQIYRSSIKHTYIIDASTNVTLKENTYYFPGWTVYANNKSVPITKNYPHFNGLQVFKLPKGLYLINVMYVRTIDRVIGDTLSIVTVILILLYLFIRYILFLQKSKNKILKHIISL